MQIEIYAPTQGEPLPPVKWNYDELKQQLTDALAAYKGRIYTEDTIAEAKKDRANLNKLADAIDGKRREMKSRYLAPYEEFEVQAKELAAMVKAQSVEIDAQVKAYDEARKAEKLEHIKNLYFEIMGDLVKLVPYDRIHQKKWLNVTTSMSTVEAELVEQSENIKAALVTIDSLGLPDNMAHIIKSKYLEQLDLAAALHEKERIEAERKALAEYEAKKKAAAAVMAEIKRPEPALPEIPNIPAPEQCPQQMTALDFRVWVTSEQMAALKAFLKNNGIKYGRVPHAE